MSKSATIQRIIKLEPIPGADRIEKATVLGWEVVVQKGLYKEEDLIIYIEIDSLLPQEDKYDFIQNTRTDENGKDWYYVKTIKLRKQISQGLILPLNTLTEEAVESLHKADEKLKNNGLTGVDVSEALGIIHYEKPVPADLRGQVKGNFPGFLRKTDEERIQSNPSLLEELKDSHYYITVKLDGTSGTFYKHEGEFGACSRNQEKKEYAGSTYWQIAEKYNLKEISDNICIQGEICGPGIQQNKLQLKEKEFYVFNIYEIKPRRFLNFEEILKFCLKYDLKTVPLEEVNGRFDYTQEELLEKAKGKYENTDRNREGIVVRSMNQEISFKVLNNDFLLKDE